MKYYTIKVTTEEEAARICKELIERGFSEISDIIWMKTFVNTTEDARVNVVFMWRIRQ